MVKDKYIKIPEDINFLLELCRALMRRIRADSPNEDIPVTIEEIKRLRSIKETYREIEFGITKSDELIK